jgi:hypothetical protein
MSNRRTQMLAATAALLVGALRWLCRARVPDDYDAIGFVRAVGDFDLARLQPHFPGYPVFVALGKIAHALPLSALDALCLVSATAAAVTAFALWRIGARLGGVRAGAVGLALYACASGPWLLGGSALSDGVAAMFATVAFAALVEKRLWLAGLAIGLMLGARASYWPLALSFVLLCRDRRALVGAAVGVAAWLAPFIAIVGPRVLLALGRTHVAGHFTIWGGSVATEPHLGLRAASFVRGLFFDGLAPSWPLLAVVLLLLALPCADRRGRGPGGLALPCADRRGRAPSLRRPSRAAFILAAPYALWVFFAQNVVEQPRHLLPLWLLLLAGAALSMRHPLRAAALAITLAAAAVPVAVAHARALPAAEQAARFIGENYSRGDAVVFGTRSIRFIEANGMVTRQRQDLGEVWVDLTRLAILPPHILVTDELAGVPSHGGRTIELVTFCRDERLDRQKPCLTLREYQRR